MDITTTNAWTLRREVLSTRPDDFLASLRSAVSRVVDGGGGYDPDGALQRAAVSS